MHRIDSFIFFRNILNLYPDMFLLKSLLAGLTLPRQTPEEVDQGQTGQADIGASPVLFPPRPTSPWSMSHLAPFLHKIKKDNSEGNQVLTPCLVKCNSLYIRTLSL